MAEANGRKSEKIEYAEFEKMLENLDVSDEEIASYLVVNDELSDAFDPVVEIDWSKVERPPETALEGAVAVAMLNSMSRSRRRRKYLRKIKGGFDGIKIVSEGDSWFQYPFLLKDVIDHLSNAPDVAIRSLGAAGDLLVDMLASGEFTDVIEAESPDLFLISGGGNDLVGDKRLAKMVHEFDDGLPADQYPNQSFTDFEDEITDMYSRLFSSIAEKFPNLRVLCHGYDYAIPDNGKWLGKPLKQRNINDKGLQTDIVHVIMDRFNARLSQVVAGFPNVQYVDCRNAVKNWHDELHPENADYGLVAARFAAAIRNP